MNTISKVGSIFVCGSLLSLGACQVTVNDSSDGGADAATSETSTADSSTTDADAGTDADASAVTYLRLAALSPDSDAVDYCVASHGTTDYVGPIIYGIGPQLGVDGSKGLTYGETSIYVSMAPGYYDVRVVPAGAISCTKDVITTNTSVGYFGQDAYHTLALVGDASVSGSDPSISLVNYTDGQSSSGYTTFRFVHASPSLPSLEFGFGTLSDSNFDALFSSVSFSKVGTSSSYGTVDTNGYLTTSTWSDKTVSIHTTVGATSDSVAAVDVNMAAGTLVSFWAIGEKTGDTTHPLQILQCVDNGAVTGYLVPCSVISQ